MRIERITTADGYVALSDAPGIGTDLYVDACRAYAAPGEPFFDEGAL